MYSFFYFKFRSEHQLFLYLLAQKDSNFQCLTYQVKTLPLSYKLLKVLDNENIELRLKKSLFVFFTVTLGLENFILLI